MATRAAALMMPATTAKTVPMFASGWRSQRNWETAAPTSRVGMRAKMAP